MDNANQIKNKNHLKDILCKISQCRQRPFKKRINYTKDINLKSLLLKAILMRRPLK